MAAGLGFKTFTTGEVLTAGDVNGYLMQGINVFASSAARASAITSPQEGQYSFLKDTNALEYYDGAAWVGAPVGDITAVTAGTGISGGGSSGDVTITNSMATAIDAKGDLVPGTGADTFARLAVGANDTVLTADSTAATGLKWATPASSGGMTLLSTTTLSGVSTTINITPTGYTYIYFTIAKMGFTGTGVPTQLLTRINGTTSANYVYNNKDRDNAWTKGTSQTSISSVNGYENSDAQWVQGQVTLPNQTTNFLNVSMTYYFASAANQGFGLTWGARETTQAALTSLTFFSANGAATFVNSPQCLIYGVK
jgi:hypothetical protein